jgi:hypothetical protein
MDRLPRYSGELEISNRTISFSLASTTRMRISGFSAGDFARIRQAISLQSGTLLGRILGARLDASLLTK